MRVIAVALLLTKRDTRNGVLFFYLKNSGVAVMKKGKIGIQTSMGSSKFKRIGIYETLRQCAGLGYHGIEVSGGGYEKRVFHIKCFKIKVILF